MLQTVCVFVVLLRKEKANAFIIFLSSLSFIRSVDCSDPTMNFLAATALFMAAHFGAAQSIVLNETNANDAKCYAERYPNLKDGFCNGDAMKCDLKKLQDHYLNHGVLENLIWQCIPIYTASSPKAATLLNPGDLLDINTNSITDPIEGAIEGLIYETETDSPDIAAMQHSISTVPGIHLTTFGQGTQFRGFGSKYSSVLPLLENFHPRALVVISDGRDVLINAGSRANEALEAFKGVFLALTFGSPEAVVVSAEASCCVSALTYAKPGDYFDRSTSQRNKHACSSGEAGCLWAGDKFKLPWVSSMQVLAKSRTRTEVEHAYLNAGLVAGRAEDLRDLFQALQMEDYEDDQAVMTDFMISHPDSIVLDYAQEMFGNNKWGHGVEGCVFSNVSSNGERLMHKKTGVMPLFVHSPGKNFECHDNLARKLGDHPDDAAVAGKRRLRGLGMKQYGPTAPTMPAPMPTQKGKGKNPVPMPTAHTPTAPTAPTAPAPSTPASMPTRKDKEKGKGKNPVPMPTAHTPTAPTAPTAPAPSTPASMPTRKDKEKGKGKNPVPMPTAHTPTAPTAPTAPTPSTPASMPTRKGKVKGKNPALMPTAHIPTAPTVATAPAPSTPVSMPTRKGKVKGKGKDPVPMPTAHTPTAPTAPTAPTPSTPASMPTRKGKVKGKNPALMPIAHIPTAPTVATAPAPSTSVSMPKPAPVPTPVTPPALVSSVPDQPTMDGGGGNKKPRLAPVPTPATPPALVPSVPDQPTMDGGGGNKKPKPAPVHTPATPPALEPSAPDGFGHAPVSPPVYVPTPHVPAPAPVSQPVFVPTTPDISAPAPASLPILVPTPDISAPPMSPPVFVPTPYISAPPVLPPIFVSTTPDASVPAPVSPPMFVPTPYLPVSVPASPPVVPAAPDILVPAPATPPASVPTTPLPAPVTPLAPAPNAPIQPTSGGGGSGRKFKPGDRQ